MNIEEKIITALNNKKKTLSVAESCTGGFISNLLTNIPGSSHSFILGIIAYSNEAKCQLLKISPKTIKKYGSVSEQIAIDMAKGIRKIHNTSFGLSITGIAGPTGGTKNKPIGLTFIAINTEYETLCLKCQFQGTRTSIKSKAAKEALKVLHEFLNQNE